MFVRRPRASEGGDLPILNLLTSLLLHSPTGMPLPHTSQHTHIYSTTPAAVSLRTSGGILLTRLFPLPLSPFPSLPTLPSHTRSIRPPHLLRSRVAPYLAPPPRPSTSTPQHVSLARLHPQCSGQDGSTAACEVQRLASGLFHPRNAQQQLALADLVPNAPNDLSIGVCEGANPLMCSAAGAVLAFMKEQHAADELARGPFTMGGIRVHLPSAFMMIDQMTLRSLDIFKFDMHQNMMGGKAKEGLSLFSILDRTKSTVGRKLLRHWMSKPVLDSDVILDRHDMVGFVVGMLEEDGPADGDVSAIHKELGRVKDVSRAIKRLSTLKTRTLVNEWSVVFEFCSAALAVHSRVDRMVNALNSQQSQGKRENGCVSSRGVVSL